jgi:hypothetical protein
MTKLCIHCKFFEETGPFKDCRHYNNGVNLVDGITIRNSAFVNRSNSSQCGEEGKWYEEKEYLITFEFRRLTLTGFDYQVLSRKHFHEALTKAKQFGYKPCKWYNPFTWFNSHRIASS